MENKRQIGTSKEQLAATYLEAQGYKIRRCNYCCRTGEIDLIANDGEYLVFVEVKYRKNTRTGYPEEAISKSKMRSLIKTARDFLFRHGISVDDISCRFDVVAILGETITVYKNAFDINDIR